MNDARQADLELVADYFEDMAWDWSWDPAVIAALARVKYPDRGPFHFVVDGETMGGDEAGAAFRDSRMDAVHMRDVRDRDGKPLPESPNTFTKKGG